MKRIILVITTLAVSLCLILSCVSAAQVQSPYSLAQAIVPWQNYVIESVEDGDVGNTNPSDPHFPLGGYITTTDMPFAYYGEIYQNGSLIKEEFGHTIGSDLPWGTYDVYLKQSYFWSLDYMLKGRDGIRSHYFRLNYAFSCSSIPNYWRVEAEYYDLQFNLVSTEEIDYGDSINSAEVSDFLAAAWTESVLASGAAYVRFNFHLNVSGRQPGIYMRKCQMLFELSSIYDELFYPIDSTGLDPNKPLAPDPDLGDEYDDLDSFNGFYSDAFLSSMDSLTEFMEQFYNVFQRYSNPLLAIGSVFSVFLSMQVINDLVVVAFTLGCFAFIFDLAIDVATTSGRVSRRASRRREARNRAKSKSKSKSKSKKGG